MQKIMAVARVEYVQALRSKAFLIGVFMMPVIMGGSIAAQVMLAKQTDLTDRRCAIVDGSGDLYQTLAEAARERNQNGIWSESVEGREREQERPRFLLESYTPPEGERADLALSRKVQAGELIGFLIIDPLVSAEAGESEPVARPMAYYTENPTFTELPNWLGATVNSELRRRRFEEANLDSELVAKLNRGVSLTTFGLPEERSDGSVAEAQEEHKARTFFVPAASMFLLFLLIFSSAPALMNQVLEEKMQRISEVLVSAVSPFQLMMGKLMGTVAISMTLAVLYLGAVWWATHHYGVQDFVPGVIYLWLPLFLVLALFMYGSIFSALGSACSELRDAQSMMMPAMILIMIPMFAWTAVIESPNGTIATVLTFFPTATPLILLLRVAAPPGPPAWEVVGGLVVCIAATIVCVAASGKIFRIGVLSQGQTPSFKTLVGWIFTK